MALMQLPFRLRLEAPALFALTSESAQVTQTVKFVPGSAVWGWLAARYIEAHSLGTAAHQDPTFARLFLRGGLRVLNAYKVLDHEVSAGVQPRTLPAPLSFKVLKANDQDLRDLAHAPCTEPVKDPKPFVFVGPTTGSRVFVVEPTTSLNYHIQVDPAARRPTERGGNLFVYESLDAGQEFDGFILGEPDDLAAAQRLLTDGTRLELGRSRRTQYGGMAQVSLGQQQPFAHEGTEAKSQDDKLVVTLTSHLLTVGDGGTGAPRFPYRQFAELLLAAGYVDGDAATLASRLAQRGGDGLLDAVFAATDVLGGFSGVWGLPRQQTQAFRPGSVWVFKGLHLTEQMLQSVGQASLGVRTGEGFGRFVLNLHGYFAPKLAEAHLYRPPLRERPAGSAPAPFVQLARSAVLAAWQDQVRTRAMADATAFAIALSGRATPSASVLTRFINLVSRPLPSGGNDTWRRLTRREFSDWRQAATRQLRAARASLSGSDERLSLLDVIDSALADNPRRATDALHPLAARLQTSPSLSGYRDAADSSGDAPAADEGGWSPLVPEYSDALVDGLARLYLQTLFRVLAERRRNSPVNSVGPAGSSMATEYAS